jgi:SNF2 family DNA or RNA helicase
MMLSNTSDARVSDRLTDATRLIHEKEYGQALTVLEELVNEYPDCGSAWQMISDIAAAMGDQCGGHIGIAATELLRRLHGIARVLVVCPASLKGEWQEQIARFSGAATLLVSGPRPARLAQYAQPGFFTVVNYEQVVIDAADINHTLRPDIVILDEAQRIKNWNTIAARALKLIVSPYALVLTGTPLENRLEELVSIVQFVDRFRQPLLVGACGKPAA